jgi:putative transposase
MLCIVEQLLNQVQSVADVCRALDVSAPTYHRWQQLYGRMKVTEANRLKELEPENTCLNLLLAEGAGALVQDLEH